MKITSEAAGTNYDQKLLTWLAAGSLPDIVQTNDNYAIPFKKAKITRDMIPFAKATKFPYEDFEKTFLDLGMVDGELHMLPQQGDTITPYVNLRMAKEIGWDAADHARSCQGHRQVDLGRVHHRLQEDERRRCRQAWRSGRVRQDQRRHVRRLHPVDAWYIYVPMVLAEGGQFISDDGKKSLINSPEGISAFKKLTDPMKDGIWAPLTLIQTMGNQSGNVFQAAKAGMSPLQRLWSPPSGPR